MGRKKKKEEVIYKMDPLLTRPFNPDTDLPPLSVPDYFPPETIEVTTLDDSYKRTYISNTGGYVSDLSSYLTTTGAYGEPIINTWGSKTIKSSIMSSTVYDSKDLLKWREEEMKKEVGDVKIDIIKSSRRDEHIVACQNKEDLTIDNILTTLSAVKARLMYEIAPIRIKQIECRVTPLVKDTIIKANKKLKMYGKDKPIVACFDEYGKRLPDKIEIGESGITLYVVDPKEYGELYYELKAIELPNEEGDTMSNWWYDAPF